MFYSTAKRLCRLLPASVPVMVVLWFLGCMFPPVDHSNEPPSAPAEPVGPDTCTINDSVQFRVGGAVDPEGLPLYYNIVWGDGTASDWSDLIPPGGTVTFGRRYSAQGTYYLYAHAYDGQCSSFSPNHQLVVR